MKRKRQGSLSVGDFKWVAKSVTDGGGEVLVDGEFLLCNGSAVSRTKYATLFAEIGTAHGVGDGSTTFNLPNGKGRGVFGQHTSGAMTVRGASVGTETETLTIAQMPAHFGHTSFVPNSLDAVIDSGGGGGSVGSAPVTSGSAGGGGAHTNLSPYLVVGGLAIKAVP